MKIYTKAERKGDKQTDKVINKKIKRVNEWEKEITSGDISVEIVMPHELTENGVLG